MTQILTLDYNDPNTNIRYLDNNVLLPFCEITPYKCPVCGETFTLIKMPTRLPFDPVEVIEKESEAYKLAIQALEKMKEEDPKWTL